MEDAIHAVEKILHTHGVPKGKLENFHGRYDDEAWRFKTHGKYISLLSSNF